VSLADYYDASYPPELWETPTAPVAAARPSAAEDEGSTVPAGTVLPVLQAADQQERVLLVDPDSPVPGTLETTHADVPDVALPPLLTVTAGSPGSYSPAVTPAERPRNVTELQTRGTPEPADPWAPGQYVPVGERGKRAHWDGEAWRSGEAPPFQTRARRTVPVGTVRG